MTLIICTSRGHPSLSGRFPILLFPVCFDARLPSNLALQKRGCTQRNVIKYTFAFCSVPSVPGSTLPHPEGEDLLLSPAPVIFQGPSLGSARFQTSESILPFPPPAGVGAFGRGGCVGRTGSRPPPLALTQNRFPPCSSGQPGSLHGDIAEALSLNLLRGQPHDRSNSGLKCFDQTTAFENPVCFFPSAVHKRA